MSDGPNSTVVERMEVCGFERTYRRVLVPRTREDGVSSLPAPVLPILGLAGSPTGNLGIGVVTGATAGRLGLGHDRLKERE
ncbi:MAG: hypothetical protein V2A73_07680 [Pseudomonadota bacterium]